MKILNKIEKWFEKMIIRICEFNIIVSKSIITFMQFTNDLKKKDEAFNEKIKKE